MRTKFLNCTLNLIGGQCREASKGELWSLILDLGSTRAAASSLCVYMWLCKVGGVMFSKILSSAFETHSKLISAS